MSDLVFLASAYRNAKAEHAAAFDEMETAHTAFDAATARWEAAGYSVGTARKALLEHAASAGEADRPKRGETRGSVHEHAAPEGGDAQ